MLSANRTLIPRTLIFLKPMKPIIQLKHSKPIIPLKPQKSSVAIRCGILSWCFPPASRTNVVVKTVPDIFGSTDRVVYNAPLLAASKIEVISSTILIIVSAMTCIAILERFRKLFLSPDALNKVGFDIDTSMWLGQIVSFSFFVAFVVGIVCVGPSMGLEISYLAWVGGAVAAFASTKIITNVISGILVMVNQPFNLGDIIKCDKFEGTVVDIGLTETILLSSKEGLMMVPNSMFPEKGITNKTRGITNETRCALQRLSLEITVKRKNVELVQKLSNQVTESLKDNDRILSDKSKPFLHVSKVDKGAFTITFCCNVKVMGEDEMYALKEEILLYIMGVLEDNGIEFADK